MEKVPGKNQGTSKYESALGTFEVLDLASIKSADIADSDRAFIYTESGNRYMLRHSKTRGGSLIIYNEHEGGFGPENGHPFVTKTDTIATVGTPMEFFNISDEARKMGRWAHSTSVIRIEVRKGFEAAIASAFKGEALGRGVANMMIDEVMGRRKKDQD